VGVRGSFVEVDGSCEVAEVSISMHVCRVQDGSWKCFGSVLITKMRALDYCMLAERQHCEAATSVSPRLFLIDNGKRAD